MVELEITCFEIGRLSLTLADFYNLPRSYPGRTTELALPIYCYHLRIPGRSVLVDAPAYGVETIPTRYLLPGYEPPPSLPDQMRARGTHPDAVTDVVITHTHFDHFNGISRTVAGRAVLNFPRARHYLGAGDWNPTNFGKLEKNTLELAQQAGLLTLVEQTLDLGDGLAILPAPGETPGHQIVQLAHQGEHAYFVGDLYHHPLEFTEPDRNVKWADEKPMLASKAMLMNRAAAAAARGYFAHIAGPHRVNVVDDQYIWQSEEE